MLFMAILDSRAHKRSICIERAHQCYLLTYLVSQLEALSLTDKFSHEGGCGCISFGKQLFGPLLHSCSYQTPLQNDTCTN